jgi:TPR repeat protein
MAYTYGHAAQIDETKGATLLARAAAASHREAQLELGHAYRFGRGVERDTVEAYKWYALAAQKGSAGAKAEAASLERSLSAEELAQAKSRVALWKPATKELSTTQADR